MILKVFEENIFQISKHVNKNHSFWWHEEASLFFDICCTRISQSGTSKLTVWVDAVKRYNIWVGQYVIMWMVFISIISRASFKRAVLFPLNWKWHKIAFRVGINSDKSGKFIVFEFVICLTDPSVAWTTKHTEGDKKPKYSVNWLLEAIFVAHPSAMMPTSQSSISNWIFLSSICTSLQHLKYWGGDGWRWADYTVFRYLVWHMIKNRYIGIFLDSADGTN